jgi:hypothetical protein
MFRLKIMLFLGAGASKAVDIGDLYDITNRVIAKLSSSGYGGLIQHIIDTLYYSGSFEKREIDIEVIFSVLNSRVNHENTMKHLGPYAIYMNQLTSNNKASPYERTLMDHNELKNIRLIVEEEIIASCLGYDQKKAFRYYNELFRCAMDIRSSIDHQLLFHNIVTTNYDLVIESCSRQNSNIPSGTGFIEDQLRKEYVLPLDNLILGSPNLSVKYLKLHGSINWWIRDGDKRIVQRNERNPATTLMGETYSERLLIYPIYEKYISLDPYYSLHYYFRKLLYQHTDYVVIGYSFRDQSINNAFADALRANPSSRMIVVNNDMDSINKRVDSIYSDKAEKKITKIDIAFGDGRLYERLIETLS